MELVLVSDGLFETIPIDVTRHNLQGTFVSV